MGTKKKSAPTVEGPAFNKAFVAKIRRCATPSSSAEEITQTFVDTARDCRQLQVVGRDLQQQLAAARKLLAATEDRTFFVDDFIFEKSRKDSLWRIRSENHLPCDEAFPHVLDAMLRATHLEPLTLPAAAFARPVSFGEFRFWKGCMRFVEPIPV